MYIKEIFTNLTTNITVIKQVKIGFALLLLVILFLGIITHSNTSYINGQIEILNNEILPLVNENEQTERTLTARQTNIYRHEVGLASLEIERVEEENIINSLNEISSLLTEDDKSLIEDTELLINELYSTIDLLRNTDEDSRERRMLLYDLDNLNEEINFSILLIRRQILNRLNQNVAQINSFINTRQRLFLVVIICSLVFGIILGVAITKGVNKITVETKEKTYKTSSKIKEVTESAYEMKNIANKVDDKINAAFEIIQDFKNSNDDITLAVEQVSVAIQKVSNGVEELFDQAEFVLSRSKKTYQVIQETDQKIELGNKIANNTAKVIKDLQKSTDKVNKMSSKIIEITKQTDLLALNAAIEAARASSNTEGSRGEAGSGFAVVAEEVKSLANESTKVTKEIQDTVQEIEYNTNRVVAMIISQDNSDASVLGVFKQINQLSDNAKERMEEVMISAEKQVEANENMSAQTEQIAASSQEVLAQTEDNLTSNKELSCLMKRTTEDNKKLYQKIKLQTEYSEEQLRLINQVVEVNQKLKA